MQKPGRWRWIAGLLWLLLAACAQPTTTRVLFIGNSYTYINDGIDQQLKNLAPGTAVTRIAVGGYTLAQHWQAGDALKALQPGGWDFVVLQEQSQTPVTNRALFRQYAEAFDQQIRAAGGQTVLLMTWERPDSVAYGVTTANLAAAYNSVGAQLKAKVAPAGLAFARALRDRPSLSLYSSDGHPTLAGTYLAGCVLYGVIFKKSPVGNAYIDPGLTAEVGHFLQQAAADSLGLSAPKQ